MHLLQAEAQMVPFPAARLHQEPAMCDCQHKPLLSPAIIEPRGMEPAAQIVCHLASSFYDGNAESRLANDIESSAASSIFGDELDPDYEIMAASLSSAVTAQYIAEVQGLTTNLSCGIATTALLLYDVILTSGREYQYIWRSKKSWVSRGLYVWNRYMYLLYLLMNLGTIPPISDIRWMHVLMLTLQTLSDVGLAGSCASLAWIAYVLDVLSLIGPAMFTTLRIYALSRNSKILGGAALLLSMVPFVVNASTAYLKLPINLPAPLNCQYANAASTGLSIGWDFFLLVVASRGCLILVDSLAVVVTWSQTRAAIKLRAGTLKHPSLQQVMWENGTVYFCILVSMNVVDMVLVLLSIAIELEGVSSYVILFIDPISSVLNSRFLLAIHETNARLEGAADTSISSLSLHTGRGGTAQAGSPELPDFLGIIGGSFRSFHDDNEDLQSLEFAPPQDEEHQSEPEGDIQEIRRDGEYMA
ncbi:uncharacterized protein TRAVEDRAFT_49629 [Trametes versicolor FP-101664 SS1]|uniref:uncharacterized protein n=1 Tax=Trametes versicolor (strain FP-101664) TaxID=717944 RepID=UPI0004621386|nr:uncharacterized protein TRAVEDRAFT_49629 [Trametes versicolor FP-101664 SS1]EIW56807.1 hypothetical protein TRAVEDRAFT_49629 [Trametes versicolor FP-101664 SS1]